MSGAASAVVVTGSEVLVIGGTLVIMNAPIIEIKGMPEERKGTFLLVIRILLMLTRKRKKQMEIDMGLPEFGVISLISDSQYLFWISILLHPFIY